MQSWRTVIRWSIEWARKLQILAWWCQVTVKVTCGLEIRNVFSKVRSNIPLLSRLLQPRPSSSPCCWPASTAAVTPGSTCVLPGISSRIWGRIVCAVPLATSSHPSATVSGTLTPVTRASPQTLPLRAQAVRGASHRLQQHKRPPHPPLLQLPVLC